MTIVCSNRKPQARVFSFIRKLLLLRYIFLLKGRNEARLSRVQFWFYKIAAVTMHENEEKFMRNAFLCFVRLFSVIGAMYIVQCERRKVILEMRFGFTSDVAS